ncbi:MAG: FtsX-like permease family protein [Bacteriovoracia bacterium]
MKTDVSQGSSDRRLGWTLWVGFRYLKSKKSSRFLSFITLLSIGGVALGVTAMIVVLSVMDGFEAELRKRLMSTDLHVLITPKPEVPEFNQGFVPAAALQSVGAADRLAQDPRVVHVFPMISTEAIFKTQRRVNGVTVKGIDEARMEKLRSQVIETADPKMLTREEGPPGAASTVRLPGVIVGEELARMMALAPGDLVTLISPTETEGPLGAVPRLKRFVIEAIYRSGSADQELHTIFAKREAIESFLRRRAVVTQWEVVVKNFDEAPRLAAELSSQLPQFKVRDWVQLNSHLFASLKLERAAMFVILAFTIVVASFNIVTTLTLMVLEKKREISILRAMGASRREVGAIFFSEGLLIGFVGVSVGMLLAWGVCLILGTNTFFKLPDIYYDQSIPVTFDPDYYWMVAVCAIVIVVLACIYPSRRAAQLSPLEGIRAG